MVSWRVKCSLILPRQGHLLLIFFSAGQKPDMAGIRDDILNPRQTHLCPVITPAGSVQMREARLEYASRLGSRPMEVHSCGFLLDSCCSRVWRKDRHKHSSVFPILQKCLYPQFDPSSSKAFEPSTPVCR